MSRAERLVQLKEQTGAVSSLESQVCTQKLDCLPSHLTMHICMHIFAYGVYTLTMTRYGQVHGFPSVACPV